MLEAINIQKTYNNATRSLHVLRGIDLKVEKGEVFSIVGPSGAGKSTLLHILGGLDNPTEGKVTFEGQDIYRLGDHQLAAIRNKKIGFVFQFYHLLPEFTALENVILPGLVKGDMTDREVLEARGVSLLEKVGLRQRQQHKPRQLSGGEQQRVAIARALINDPAIIFCDEPTGNLDSENSEAIVHLLLELNQQNQQTFVIVTHDEQFAKYSPTTIHMRDGKLIKP